MIVKYNANSNIAFWALFHEKFLHLVIDMPSALIPQKMLNPKPIMRATTKPSVGVSIANRELKAEIIISLICSNSNVLAIR